MGYQLKYARQAEKDARLLEQAGLKQTAVDLLSVVIRNPFQNPPPYEKLKGNLLGAYSRRINRQHRFVYEVLPNIDNIVDAQGLPYEGIVRVLRMWTHYA